MPRKKITGQKKRKYTRRTTNPTTVGTTTAREATAFETLVAQVNALDRGIAGYIFATIGTDGAVGTSIYAGSRNNALVMNACITAEVTRRLNDELTRQNPVGVTAAEDLLKTLFSQGRNIGVVELPAELVRAIQTPTKLTASDVKPTGTMN